MDTDMMAKVQQSMQAKGSGVVALVLHGALRLRASAASPVNAFAGRSLAVGRGWFTQ
jgi:hypothetical protein